MMSAAPAKAREKTQRPSDFITNDAGFAVSAAGVPLKVQPSSVRHEIAAADPSTRGGAKS